MAYRTQSFAVAVHTRLAVEVDNACFEAVIDLDSVREADDSRESSVDAAAACSLGLVAPSPGGTRSRKVRVAHMERVDGVSVCS